MIIALTGYAGAGKDTLAEAFISRGWVRYAFADPLKLLAEDLHPWLKLANKVLGRERAKRWLPPVRRAYQNLGAAARVRLHDSVWTDIVVNRIAVEPRNVIITDLRYANEACAVRDLGGYIILVTRRGVGPANSHESEKLEGITADYMVRNDGTVADLWDYVDLIPDTLRRGGHTTIEGVECRNRRTEGGTE